MDKQEYQQTNFTSKLISMNRMILEGIWRKLKEINEFETNLEFFQNQIFQKFDKIVKSDFSKISK